MIRGLPAGQVTEETLTQVAYSASSGSLVTRTQEFTPDTAANACYYTKVVTAPSSAYQVTESFTYDDFGNIATDTVTGLGMPQRKTIVNWGTTGQFPMSVTDPSSATTTLTYDSRFGELASVKDANTVITSWQYEDFGRKSQESRPDGTYTQWQYVGCAEEGGCLLGSNTLAVPYDVYNVGGSVGSSGVTYFDEWQRPILTSQLMLGGTSNRNEVRYDSLGRTIKQAFPCVWTGVTTPCSYWSTMSYDLLNRPIEVQRPISSTDSTLQTTSYSYSGPTTTVTDPQEHTRTTVTDVNGWLRKAGDDYGYTITLGYDAAGSRTSATDSLGHTLWTGMYAYGTGAFLTSEDDADRGSWSYTVDALGERTGWTDAKGQSFSVTYDALSRPVTRTEPDLFTQWTWGSIAPAIGKLQSVCTGTGSHPSNCTTSPGYSEQESYDGDGRRSTREIILPNVGTFTYTWAYDATTGLLSTLTYPTSTSGYAFEVQYGYQNDILQTMTDVSDTPNVTLWKADATNPAGQVTEESLGNGIVTNRAYDAVTHWLGSVQSGVGGGSGVKNLAFLYDLMGNVEQRQDNNLGLTENVYYDGDDRFSYSELNGTENLSVGYDEMGDITSRSDVAGGAPWTYDTVHLHAVDKAGSSAYSYGPYDANGNPSSARGNTFDWSSYNYPIYLAASTGEELSFAYGPDRQRWQQGYEDADGDTETTEYIGGLMEKVSDSDGDVTYRHYLYAGSEPVAVYLRTSSGGTLDYFLTDQEGSISAITNSSAQTVVNESFTAFGDRRNPGSWLGPASGSDLTTSEAITRQGYTFQTLLGEDLGFNHMNGRVQDAITGRFLSPDPHLQDPSNPQSYSRYSYALNNPLTYIDPSGFFYWQNSCLFIGTPPQQQIQTMNQGEVLVSGTPLPIFCPSLPPWIFTPGGQSAYGGQASTSGGGGGSGGSPGTPSSPSQPTTPPSQTTTSPSTQTEPQTNPTTTCVGQGKSTGNLNNGVQGALPGLLAQQGNIAIDPAVLGLLAGASTNQVLAQYGPQITVNFSPQPTLPAGFPSSFTVGDVVGPASARGNSPPIFDINGLPNLQAAYNVTGIRQVTVTFPSSAPFTCGAGFQQAN